MRLGQKYDQQECIPVGYNPLQWPSPGGSVCPGMCVSAGGGGVCPPGCLTEGGDCLMGCLSDPPLWTE